MTKIIFTLTITAFFITNALSQSSITGIIKDSETKAPLPFASIYTPDKKCATISNSEGEFTLNIKKSNSTTVLVSYLGYETKTIRLNFISEYYQVFLKPDSKKLSEVEITGHYYTQTEIANILSKTSKKIKRENAESLSKSFIRTFTLFDDTIPKEILEGYYNIKYSQAGILDLNLKNGRFGVTKSENKVFLNLNLVSEFIRTINLTNKDVSIPLNNPLNFASSISILKRYELKLTEWSDKMYIIMYSHKLDSGINGSIYINPKTFALLKVELNKKYNDESPFVALNKNQIIDSININTTLLFDADNKQMNQLHGTIEYILYENSNRNNVSTNYLLNFYDNNYSFISPFYGSDRNLMDYELMSIMDYNSSFWQNEFTFKTTKKEEEFFKYLNNERNTVVDELKYEPGQVQNLKKCDTVDWSKLYTFNTVTVPQYSQMEDRVVNGAPPMQKMFEIKTKLFCDYYKHKALTCFNIVPYVDYGLSTFFIPRDSINTAKINEILMHTHNLARNLEESLNSRYSKIDPEKGIISKYLYFSKLEMQKFQDSIYLEIYEK